MKNKKNKNETPEQLEEKAILEKFRADRKNMRGSGGLYEMFFHDADPEFTAGIEKLLLKYSKFAKVVAEQFKETKTNPGLKAEFENAISNPPTKPTNPQQPFDPLVDPENSDVD